MPFLQLDLEKRYFVLEIRHNDVIPFVDQLFDFCLVSVFKCLHLGFLTGYRRFD